MLVVNLARCVVVTAAVLAVHASVFGADAKSEEEQASAPKGQCPQGQRS